MDFLLGQNWNESADSARYYDFRLYISDHDKRKSCFQDFVCVSSTSVAANPVFKALFWQGGEHCWVICFLFMMHNSATCKNKKCIKTRRMTQNLPTVLLPWKARMFVNHPNTSNAADCVLLHSLRKPRWGQFCRECREREGGQVEISVSSYDLLLLWFHYFPPFCWPHM